jgi:hypothetical protein
MEIRKYLSIRLVLPLLAGLLMLSACSKDKLDSKSTSLPVIDSYLIPGQPIIVKLSSQKDLADTAIYGAPISGVKVYLSDGAQKVQLTESVKGTYTYANQAFLVTGKTYSLQFDYLDYSVSASTVMPAKPVNFSSQYGGITIVSQGPPGGNSTVLNTFTWLNPDSLNHVMVFKAEAGIPITNFGRTIPFNSQYNTNRTSLFNVTSAMFSYRGKYQVILFRVNQEYINLLNNDSRSTSQNLTQVPTNIVNGFGIFTAMQADTLAFNVY